MGNTALYFIDPKCETTSKTTIISHGKPRDRSQFHHNQIGAKRLSFTISNTPSTSRSISSSLSLTQSHTNGPVIEYACPDQESESTLPDHESAVFHSQSMACSVSNMKLPKDKSKSRKALDSNILKFHLIGAKRLNTQTSELDLGMNLNELLIYSDNQLNASFGEDRIWLL